MVQIVQDINAFSNIYHLRDEYKTLFSVQTLI